MNQSPKVAVVTSRLRRVIQIDGAWIQGLRAVLRKIAAEPVTLLVGGKTAGSDLIRRGAARCGIEFEIIEPLLDGPTQDDFKDAVDSSPLDEAVISRAGQIYVLGLRTNGNLHRALRRRQINGQAGISLVDIPGLQSDTARQELIERGAILWQPSSCERRPFVVPLGASEPSIAASDRIYQIVPFPLSDEWIYLTHTTRSCPGPWPGESVEEYADSLLDSRPDANHSPLAALMRIVTQRRLIASNRSIRGGYPIVSFTACPLGELPALHCFRTHRVRWDFEPYGLCLRRSWLTERGARPVVYGDEELWRSLPPSDRPFFQIATGESGIDWTVEREWRHPGDVDLSSAVSGDVFAFVPNYEAARSLGEITNWPTTLWPDPTTA